MNEQKANVDWESRLQTILPCGWMLDYSLKYYTETTVPL